MGSKRTIDFLILNYLAGVVLFSLAQVLLPERFFLDAETIKSFMPEASFQFDFLDSFNNTAYVYKLMGFGTIMPDWIAGFLSYSIPYFLMLAVARRQKWSFNNFATVLFGAWNILIAVYMGVYSKEMMAFALSATLMLLSRSKKGIVLGLLLTAVYAAFFRIYWLLVAGFFVVNFWSLRTRKSLKFLVGFQVFAAIFVFFLANATTGLSLSETRYNINLERTDDGVSDAATMINNVFSNDSPVQDWLNGTLIWLSLLFPFFLLMTAEFQHILFLVFQLLNVLAFIKISIFLMSRGRRPGFEVTPTQVMQMHFAIAWCVAYSFVQGIFEPDFGSFARHQIVVVPMWFSLISFYVKWRKPSPVPGPVQIPPRHGLAHELSR